ncbi:MAG: DUF4381 domain-containing protein [Gammaproteobacteria bacterium]|nr:DUF4381 domain-containing protein [Gammaproteobacteria bacterium]
MIESPEKYLRDIRDIDPVGWWPPGPGWWVMLALGIALTVAGVFIWNRWKSRLGWRADARRRILMLRKRMATQDPKKTAGELSEFLRRVAMARYGRVDCAGLTGTEWLRWLAAHDPQGFDWVSSGKILVTLPYADSAASEVARQALRPLVRAAAHWVSDLNTSQATAQSARVGEAV